MNASFGPVDIHHHVVPPSLRSELMTRGLIDPVALGWSVAQTLDDMDAAGTASAVLSISTPQVSFGDDGLAARIARECNEYMAQLAGAHPDRFGFFALLPMGNVDAALSELVYALEVLGADGIGLLTSYGHKWLGSHDFSPVLDELNSRQSVLFTHPRMNEMCPVAVPDVPATVVEFGTDTTRTIVDIVFSGTSARCPDIQFIFSHAGGTMPYLVERLERMPIMNPELQERVPLGVLHELRRFHYDTAWTANRFALPTLLELVDVRQVLFGSDFPYRTQADTLQGLGSLGLSNDMLNLIQRGNAVSLIPRLAP